MTVGDVLNGWLLLLGGPAVVIAGASVVSAYNNWRSRKAVEELRDAMTLTEHWRVATPDEIARELSAYGGEYRKEWERLVRGRSTT